MIEEEIIGSQSEDSEVTGSSDDNMDDVMSLFGVENDEERSVNDKTPAKEDVIADKPEPKMMKVKHNKEEIEVDVSDDKIPEYVQKSLALDKERDRRTELEKTLDRAAKLAGYETHAAYTADLDRLEKEQEQKQKDQFQQLRQELREQADDAGLDPDKVDAWLDNHPLLQEANRAIQERHKADEERANQTVQQQWQSKWDELFKTFPETAEQSMAWERGETPVFMNAEMQSRIERGYDPVDAYKLAHADKLQTQTKAKTEQRLIKEQHLGLRSQVVTNGAADNETSVPADLANAFEAFGLPVDSAKKYMKK